MLIKEKQEGPTGLYWPQGMPERHDWKCLTKEKGDLEKYPKHLFIMEAEQQAVTGDCFSGATLVSRFRPIFYFQP